MPVSEAVFDDGNVDVLPIEEWTDRLRDGDVLLCSGRAAFSELIKVATGSVFSHVGMILYLAALDRWMVLESVESFGVRSVPLRSYVRDYCGTGKGYPGRAVIARHRELTPDTLADGKLSGFAVDMLGHPYDKDEILKIAAHIVTAGLLSEGKFQEARSYICSEYAAACYRQVGIQVARGQRSYIAPADFARDPNIDAIGILQSSS